MLWLHLNLWHLDFNVWMKGICIISILCIFFFNIIYVLLLFRLFFLFIVLMI